MNASAKRHILYFSILPASALGATVITNDPETLTKIIGFIIALGISGQVYYQRESVKEARIARDSLIEHTASIKTLDNTMVRVEGSVGRLADNQSKITADMGGVVVEVEKLKTEREEGKLIDALRWTNQEKACNEKHAHCVICLDRRREDVHYTG